jgi:co-chaperonin GroES (HSP10)
MVWDTVAAKRAWLDDCRALAKVMMPSDLYKRIHPDVWRLLPFGHRLVVMRIPEDDSVGRIVIPEQYRQQNTSGYVLVVGNEICIPDPTRGHVPFTHPLDLVGHRVNFGAYTGVPVVFHAAFNTPFEGLYVQLLAGDIHCEVMPEEVSHDPTTRHGNESAGPVPEEHDNG